jgi:ubiquinone/menaquinone biosynthesis C-methylase UbiE
VAGHVSGVDQSPEMVAQAQARNASAIKSRYVELRHGFADSLSFANDTFDKAWRRARPRLAYFAR